VGATPNEILYGLKRKVTSMLPAKRGFGGGLKGTDGSFLLKDDRLVLRESNMTAQSLGNHSKLISGSLWTRSPNNRLRENEKLEKAEAKYRSTAGRKDLGRKLRHTEIASQLEGEETDTKSDSAG
jgi:hypothetical protein